MDFIDAIQSFDLSVLDRIQQGFRGSFADGMWKFITLFGEGGIFWIAVGVVLLLFRRTRKGGLAMLIAIAAGFLISNIILKNAVARIRPYDVNTLLPLAVKRLSDFSFPSGHTTASLSAGLALLYVDRKIGIPAFVLGVLISISRLHLYVHYPSDVLAAVCVALITSLIGFIAAELIMRKFEPWFDGKINALKARKAKAVQNGGDNISSPSADTGGNADE